MNADDTALRQAVRYVSIDRQIERHRAIYYSTLSGQGLDFTHEMKE